jgi:hypothetical protein
MRRRQHGFDVVAVTNWLENWCLEHFACPVGGPNVEGKALAIRQLLEGHWGEHGVHRVIRRGGLMLSAPRCSEAPCPVLGVALARLEILFYEVTVAEQEEVSWLRQAVDRFSISESTRAELLARAEQLAAGFTSPAVGDEAPGTPQRTLAQLVAQHLRAGGFSQSAIAKIMGASIETTGQRCRARPPRSLSAVIGRV